MKEKGEGSILMRGYFEWGNELLEMETLQVAPWRG